MTDTPKRLRKINALPKQKPGTYRDARAHHRAWHLEQKITLGEMRASGVRGLLVYCADYKCAHAIRLSADRWPDHVRLRDVE